MRRLSTTGAVSARRVSFSDLCALAALLCLWAVFPALAADLNKTIRVAFPAAETTFDPQVIFDIYSFRIAENINESMLQSNSGKANDARFRLPEYDRMYERARLVPNSPERTQLYQQMTKLMLVYAPWKLGVHRRVNFLIQPWISGYKEHPILRTTWRYLDVDLAQRKATR